MSGSKYGPLDWRQRQTDAFEASQAQHDARQAQIHTAMPGKIVAFNPKTMTATVAPSIQAVRRQDDGSAAPVDIHPIHDVPVQFPGGGGHTMTFPVRVGDECMIQFVERSLDNWHQNGHGQAPSDYRMHDINDAVAHVGIRSQPNVLADFSAGTTQIRSDDGKTVIDLDGAGGNVTIKTTTAVAIDAPKLTVTGDIECKGEVTAKFGGPFVRLSTHTHPAAGAPPTPMTREGEAGDER